MKRTLILIISLFNLSLAGSELNQIQIKTIVDAIRRVEGSPTYGIKSVHFKNQIEARAICARTVQNTYSRWKNSNQKITYFEFLSKRYAPIGAGNDPHNLNKNWLRNFTNSLPKNFTNSL